jgi:hypothetical protein
MGRSGSTTSVRARQMRRTLARWQRSGLTLREFGRQRGIPVSTLTWWRQVFRRAGEEAGNGAAVENAVVFTELPQPANVPSTPSVLEIVLHSGHVVRVPAGADTGTLQRVLQALQTTC